MTKKDEIKQRLCIHCLEIIPYGEMETNNDFPIHQSCHKKYLKRIDELGGE